jgi:hypothetical protein
MYTQCLCCQYTCMYWQFQYIHAMSSSSASSTPCAFVPQKRHLGCSLSQLPECFLPRSAAEIVLRSSSWWVLGLKIWRKLDAWHTLFSKGLRGGRCTKFEVNQTNLKRVILPAVSSASSDDLRPDISWRQADVRPDVSTKCLTASPISFSITGNCMLRATYTYTIWCVKG